MSKKDHSHYEENDLFPASADVARERSIYIEIGLSGYGTDAQMRQSAADAVKYLAITRQEEVTGTLDDGTEITFNRLGNPVHPIVQPS